MRILLLGGSKSGKSMMGQHMARRLSAGAPMYYWATLEPRDGEDRAIVRRHLAERDGWGFETIEQGRQLPQALKWVSPAGTVLFDSVTEKPPDARRRSCWSSAVTRPTLSASATSCGGTA